LYPEEIIHNALPAPEACRGRRDAWASFPGHGDTLLDSHSICRASSTVERLRALEMAPFAAAVTRASDDRARAVRLRRKAAASLSRDVVTGWLREARIVGSSSPAI
jgi:hypothetical protein